MKYHLNMKPDLAERFIESVAWLTELANKETNWAKVLFIADMVEGLMAQQGECVDRVSDIITWVVPGDELEIRFSIEGGPEGYFVEVFNGDNYESCPLYTFLTGEEFCEL